MPHACTKCSQVYPDKSEAILRGCACGSRVFSFIKSTLPPEHSTLEKQLSQSTANGSTLDSIVEQIAAAAGEKTIILDPTIEQDAVENIRVLEPGAYYLNIGSLMKGGPVILRSDADVYYVRLPQPSGNNVKNGEQHKKVILE